MPDTRGSRSSPPTLVWFRDDLRLADHPALTAAVEDGGPVLAVYVHDEQTGGVRPLGGAARWWLHSALEALDRQVRAHGGALLMLEGPAPEVICALAAETGARAVHCHYRYQREARAQDEAVRAALRSRDVRFEQHHGTLLRPPGAVQTRQGTPYKVFTAYWRAVQDMPPLPPPLPVPPGLRFHRLAGDLPASVRGIDLETLLPQGRDWAAGLRESWVPGEEEGTRRLDLFAGDDLRDYDSGRDFPGRSATSRLSPYLRFGHVSPRQVWSVTEKASGAARGFRQELGWRDFCWNTLHDFPDLARRPMRGEFATIRWRDAPDDLQSWQRGRTGVDIVDAGMRQLWHTGWMHNRVRMIAGSFLVKHLLTDWRAGEAWFWDTLVDADAANNAANWQWVAGCGVDAAPFFRVFNPVRQAERFDPDGDYVRQWCAHGADAAARKGRAIVDLDEGRDRALAAYRAVRKGSPGQRD